MASALPTAWDYAKRLKRLLAHLQPDLIHSNGLKMHLFACLARPAGRPIVWHLHDFYGLRPVTPLLVKGARRGVAGAIAISEAVARDARRVLPGLPVEVILNAIDTDTFTPGPGDGAALDRLAGLTPAPPGTVRVGLVATYARWKGQEILLEAAARLAGDPAGPPTRFYIVGGPIYLTGAQYAEAELRQRADGLGLRERVGFVGFQQETTDVYRALDVVVHASTRPEPFGLTVAEAMACGRAVVVTEAGGAAELFTHGHDALGVPPGDSAALACTLSGLLVDPGIRLQLGTNARATAVRRFHSSRLGPQVLKFYRRILARRSRLQSSGCWRDGSHRDSERLHPMCRT
jgi:glycosyltransferase involved in cell wall biosynthesis